MRLQKSYAGFKKDEAKIVGIILAIIAVVSFFGFRDALRRSRDAQRKSDVRNATDSINKYQNEVGVLPISVDGKINACNGGVDVKGFPIYKVCEWGKDALEDFTRLGSVPYLKLIPLDPDTGKGKQYLYISNGSHFQIYAALEGKDEAEYDKKIVKRQLLCGNKICNFGLSSGITPLDKSLEEYENELLDKEKK